MAAAGTKTGAEEGQGGKAVRKGEGAAGGADPSCVTGETDGRPSSRAQSCLVQIRSPRKCTR